MKLNISREDPPWGCVLDTRYSRDGIKFEQTLGGDFLTCPGLVELVSRGFSGNGGGGGIIYGEGAMEGTHSLTQGSPGEIGRVGEVVRWQAERYRSAVEVQQARREEFAARRGRIV
jgi:hypothetical protein